MTTRKTRTATPRKTTRRPATSEVVETKAAAGAPTEGKKPRSRTSKKPRAASVAAAVSHERIAHEAFLIWEQSGRPHGEELTHWLEAERRLAAPAATHAA